jgi:hypothetical protein
VTERTRWGLLKRLCQCIGLASIVLVVNYSDFLGGGVDARMHVPYGLAPVCVAQIADIVLLGLGIFIVLGLLARTRVYSWVQLLVLVFLPPYIAERTRTVVPFLTDGRVLLFFFVWTAFVLLLLLKLPRWYATAVRLADAAGVFAAVFALCSIAQIATVMLWRPGPQQIHPEWASAPQPPRTHPRIVWVIFDELSHDQTFDHRAHGLELPNFDALRNESTLYTQVRPIGLKTVEVIPSLLSGHVVEDFRFSYSNRLRVHDQDQRGWHRLDGAGTVFHDAQAAGWRTAAVGWYNPYCPLYGDALNSCYWSNLDPVDGDMAQSASVWTNIRQPLKELGMQLRSSEDLDRATCDFNVDHRQKTHKDIQEHALDVLHEDQADLIFLHLGVPHSPNLWSRINNDYADGCGSSYLDNLALADIELGRMLAVLKNSPRWKDTTVIVEGDHSWRVMLWDWLPSWTDEDDQASHGRFDPRPALLIHNAGQTQPLTDARPLSLLVVHGAVEQVLAGHPAQP